MKTYAIGDLQGCYSRAADLVKAIEAETPDARFIFVGDLVNRGPDSLTTLKLVRSLGERARALLGNHDLHLLAVSQGIRSAHRTDTLDDILSAPDRDDLLDWLRSLPLAIFEQGHLLVHAGVLPQWTAQKTIMLAHEVENCLRSPDWVAFLREMYGNQPAKWDDELTGNDRLRCIVNALTRLRFCTPDGVMDLTTTKGADAAPDGLVPWFNAPQRMTEDVTVVFGHWSTLGLTLRPNLLGLDTGCLWGGKLSAVCLEDRSVIQLDCPQYQRPGAI